MKAAQIGKFLARGSVAVTPGQEEIKGAKQLQVIIFCWSPT